MTGVQTCALPISVRCGNVNDNTVTAFNNHQGQLVVDVAASNGASYQLQMFDALGKKVIASAFIADPGKHHELVDISNLDKGVYFVYLTSISGSTTRKISVD